MFMHTVGMYTVPYKNILFRVYNGGVYSLCSKLDTLGVERSGTSEMDLQIFSVFCNIV